MKHKTNLAHAQATAAVSGMVLVSTDQLRELIVDAIAEHVAPPTQPAVVDCAGLCQALGLSRPSVAKLVASGKIPFLLCGDVRRFVLADVIAALKVHP